MELEHHFSVPASIEETWAALNYPERVAPCFPGASLTPLHGPDPDDAALPMNTSVA